MSIDTATIKVLREKTGAGIVDCKNALINSNGDIEAAVELLRKQGLASAHKKASRSTSEGLIALALSEDRRQGALVEVNSETDFVAKNDKFIQLAKQIGQIALARQTHNRDELLAAPANNGTVQDFIKEHISIIGENLQLNRCLSLKVEQGIVAGYIHNALAEGCGKMGVLVALECQGGDQASLENLGKQIAMHIAAAAPQALTREELDPAFIQKEKEIFTETAAASGKPEAIVAKMVEGKLQKLYEEVVLLEQIFVLDGKSKVADILEQSSKQLGQGVSIKSFARFAIGEKSS